MFNHCVQSLCSLTVCVQLLCSLTVCVHSLCMFNPRVTWGTHSQSARASFHWSIHHCSTTTTTTTKKIMYNFSTVCVQSQCFVKCPLSVCLSARESFLWFAPLSWIQQQQQQRILCVISPLFVWHPSAIWRAPRKDNLSLVCMAPQRYMKSPGKIISALFVWHLSAIWRDPRRDSLSTICVIISPLFVA